MDGASLTSRHRYLLIGSGVLLAALLIGGGIAWNATLKTWDDETLGPGDASATATVPPTATRSAETTHSASATASVNATGSVQGAPQSTTRFAYVRAVLGSPGDYEVAVDYFDFLIEPDATRYANSHGIAPPTNGLLLVNEDTATELVPVSDTVEVRYAIGGIMALEMVPATVEQLKARAAGNLNAMPNASTDWWKVTVTNRVVTRIDMLVIAD